MNKFKWTYLGDQGKRHLVVLMHGAQSGNLLIICNSDILLVDFKVFQSKTYSFFIEEELCEIEIERTGDRFLYGFHTNNKADTPLNRRRKKLNKKHMFQSLAFLGGFLFLIFFGSWFLTNSNKNKQYQSFTAMLAKYHQFAEARITGKKADSNAYSFIVDGKTYSGQTKFRNISPEQTNLGIPIEPGDEFLVKYLPQNPDISEIDFSKPSDKQLKTYRIRTIEKHTALHPQKDSSYCACLINVAMDINGLKGLSDFYHQNVPVAENKRHNTDSYNRLVRSVSYKEKVSEQCFQYK